MSWFFKSLQSDDPDSPSSSSPSERHGGPAGVKDDLSSIGQTFGRQLRGVANFLAPPPSPPSSSFSSRGVEKASSKSELSDDSSPLVGIRIDLAEFGGSLRSRLSLLSGNRAVSEFSKFTSSLLNFHDNITNNANEEEEEEEEEEEDGDEEEAEEEEDYVAGITEEVVDFVKEISSRPEFWTDFPLSPENDFVMSDAQLEHASTIESMVPNLAALRAKLHDYMGDEQFWMIYFVFLLPRVNEQDFEMLATAQIVETRNVLLKQLQDKKNGKAKSSENSYAADASNEQSKVHEKQEAISPGEADIVKATEGLEIDDEENAERWLEESDIDVGTSVDNQKELEHEEDVSFSDLEDVENDHSTRLSVSTQAPALRAPSPSGSIDWVQLNESSEKAMQSTSRDKDSDGDSNDWLKVDASD